MYKYIVYKTTNKVNGYIYIGVHRTDTDIYDGYIGCGLYDSIYSVKQFKHYKYHHAVKKYGVKSFVRETLFEYDDTEDGKLAAYKKEAELVNRDFLKRKDVYNTCLGGKVPSSVMERPVAQYAMDGTFIRSYYSITHASQSTGISHSGIQSACAGDIKFCKDYQWRYFDGNESSIDSIEPKHKPIYQFDLQGNYLAYYKNAHLASDASNAHHSAITDVCNGKRRSAGGYYWSYEKHFNYCPPEPYMIAVASYTDDGDFVKSYMSITEAAKEMNVGVPTLYKAVKGYKKHCAEYRWRYFYGNTTKIESLKD